MLVLTGQCFDRLRETQFIVLSWQWRVSKPLTSCTNILLCCERIKTWVMKCSLLPNIVKCESRHIIPNPLRVNPSGPDLSDIPTKGW